MTDFPERALASNFAAGNLDTAVVRDLVVDNLEEKTADCKLPKTSLFSSFFSSALSIIKSHTESSLGEKTTSKSGSSCWTTTVKKVMYSGSLRRLQERILGKGSANALNSTSDIWLLGKCYDISPQESTDEVDPGSSCTSFLEDFSSRIWITYRKGFEAIGDSKYTSDVNWGCMIRSSQMLVAQALIFHYMGRSWRKPPQKPYDSRYIEILHSFGDSESHTFSIHKLLEAGKAFGLVVGSWVGPYAMCRAWETLVNANKAQTEKERCKETLPMVVYVVSGDGDGERGGAPVLSKDVVVKLCSMPSKDQLSWASILLLVPLVLGVGKMNPRYIPLLRETLTFPQSVGILGGKPGASTYIIGTQDDEALYLDPHEVQPVVVIKKDDLEADTSSYHCSTVRHLPLDQIDSSLAIGFYCRDKEDFEDFCYRASQISNKSIGTPLFTIVEFLQPAKLIPSDDGFPNGLDSAGDGVNRNVFLEDFSENEADGADEWQML